MNRSQSYRPVSFTMAAISLLILLFGLWSPLIADEMEVKRDKEKTTYTIGGSEENRREEAKERDKAWDMLKHMPIIIDGRTGQPSTTAPAAPAVPAR